jgi:ribosomal protein S18 acetylase RimI-like enzyme
MSSLEMSAEQPVEIKSKARKSKATPSKSKASEPEADIKPLNVPQDREEIYKMVDGAKDYFYNEELAYYLYYAHPYIQFKSEEAKDKFFEDKYGKKYEKYKDGLVLRDNGKIVGFMIWDEFPDRPKKVFLMFVYIDENFRKYGYGTKMMDAFLKWCKEHNKTELGLKFSKKNDKLATFYTKLGYRKDERRGKNEHSQDPYVEYVKKLRAPAKSKSKSSASEE